MQESARSWPLSATVGCEAVLVTSNRSTTEDIHALVADLLPVLVPDAELRTDPAVVLLRVENARARISTDELVQRCDALPQHQWPRAVEEWLRLVGAEAERAVTEVQQPGDPHDRLRVVLGTRDGPPGAAGDLARVAVPFGRYFAVHTALDDDGTAHVLTKLRAGLLSLHDVGERAVRNTMDLEVPRIAVRSQQLTLRERATVVTLPGSPYASAALLDIRKVLPTSCPYGALVGVPRASMLIVYPVTSSRVLQFIPEFADIVLEMHDTAVDACSHRTFWWADDMLLEIPVRPASEHTETRVEIPPEFEELVRRLPRE